MGVAAPPLTEVQAPDRVFLVGRLKSPAQLMDTAETWIQLPKRWRELLDSEVPGATQVLDLSSPVDVIVAMDEGGAMQEPKFRAAFSVGLTSLEGALDFSKKTGQQPERIAPGAYRVSGDCIVARSLGRSPARVVCGDSKAATDELLDFATRGLPARDLGPEDIRIEVKAEPFRKRYGKDLGHYKRLAMPFIREELAVGYAPFDRAMSDAATALIDEGLALVEDVDVVRVVGTLDGKGQRVRLGFELGMRGKKSWVSTQMEQSGTRAKPAPALFWDLPSDATGAAFSIPGDPKAFAPIRDALAELLDTFLAHQKLAAGPRKNLVGAVEKIWVSEGASVYAAGAVPADAKIPASDARFARESLRSGIGWHLMGWEEDSKRTVAYLDHLAKLSADPALRARLTQEIGKADAARLPVVRRRAPRGALPRGSVAYEFSIPSDFFEQHAYIEMPPAPGVRPAPKPAAKVQPLPVVVVVAPDGPLTWVGLSADEAVLASRLASAVAGAPKNSLATRPGLDRLRRGSFVSGGFMTLAQAMDSGKLSGEAGLADLGKQLPHGGTTPVTFTSNVKPGPGPTLTFELEMPREMLVDASTLITSGMQQVFGMGGSTRSAPPAVPYTP